VAKVITKEALDLAVEKAVAKAIKAETKRCIAAVKSAATIKEAVAAIKAAE
jgi:hypothetical protein